MILPYEQPVPEIISFNTYMNSKERKANFELLSVSGFNSLSLEERMAGVHNTDVQAWEMLLEETE